MFSFTGKNLLRIELIVGILVVNFFGYFYSEFNFEGYTKENGLLLSSAYFGVLVLSYFIDFVVKNLKYFILGLYIVSLWFVLSINLKFDFEIKYFFSFLFIYIFYAFIQDRIKIYLITNALVFVGFLYALINSQLVNNNHLLTVIFTYLLVFIVGLAITFSRSISRRKLASRKNLLNYIFNNSYNALILVNKENNKVKDANNKALNLFDLPTRYKIIGKKIEDLKTAGEYIFRSNDTFSDKQSIELKDRRIINYEVSSFDYLKESYWLINLREYKDINELNLSIEFDKMRSAKEEHYRYLFEESSSLICVTDKDGIIKDVNKTLSDKFGYNKEELIGKKFNFLDNTEYTEREEQNKTAWEGKRVEFEKGIKTKSGEILEIETILRKGKYFGEEVLISNSRDISKRKELERRVQYNIRRYVMLFEQSPISIAISDTEGNLMDFNSSFVSLLGYSEEELKSMNVRQFSQGEDMQENLNKRNDLLEGKTKQMEMQKRYITKSGEVIYTLLKTLILKDEQENRIGLLAQIIDISDIQKAQQKIEISEKSYRDLFNHSYDLLYILNKENQFIDVNKAVLEKYGYSEKEIIGKTPVLLSAPDLNDLAEVNRRIQKAREGEEQNILWWSKKKNGDIFPKDLNLKKGIYKGEDVLMATGRDISESYYFERKLKEKEKRYRNLFERNLAGVYRTSQDGKLLECNNSFAQILGFNSKDEIKAEANANHFYVDKNERVKLVIKLKENRYVRGEKIHLIRKDGEEITALLNVSAIYDQNDNFNYFEGSLIDITQLDRAQDLLKESQEKYRKLIDNASFGILIFFDNNVIFSNEKAAQILKYNSKAALIGKGKYDFLQKADDPSFLKRLKKIEQNEDVPFRELKFYTAEGSLIDVETKPTKVNFENKVCTLISFIDITDRKKVKRAHEKAKTAETFNKILQAELKEKEKAQKRLVDAQSYTEGIIESSIDMIFTTDINGRINRLNSAAKKELQLKKEQINKPIEIVFKKVEEGASILKELEKTKSFTGEVELQRTDGSSFPAYLSMSYLYNSDDVVLGIMGVSRDISSIKQKEIEIKKQAAKLNTIIESSSHFFFTVNRKYQITTYNHVFENDVKNNIGKKLKPNIHFYEIFPEYLLDKEKEIENFWDINFKAAFKGDSVSFVLERKNLDGNVYFREIYLNPIHSDDGSIEEISGIGHDITDKKLSEQSLKSSLQEKEVLLKEVHHRVKNNMQVISSILSLQSAYVDDEKILSILLESQNRIKSMAFIHEKLYRTENFSQIKFSDYVQNLAQNLIDTYELSVASVDLKCDLEEVFLNLDNAIPCGLIINELISNSLKYAFVEREKGEIQIVLKTKNNQVELKIADNGAGIPKGLDIYNTDSLGLQLVNTLVEQLEGNLKLDLEKVTSFTITFDIKVNKDV
jgi:PAS domain S-box-containing protein